MEQQQSVHAVRFWDMIDQIRTQVFTNDDLLLLEAIKPADRLEEHIARL